ncbi:MAG: hypothetical protein WDW20_01220 [Neisseriaceae bacterium]
MLAQSKDLDLFALSWEIETFARLSSAGRQTAEAYDKTYPPTTADCIKSLINC